MYSRRVAFALAIYENGFVSNFMYTLLGSGNVSDCRRARFSTVASRVRVDIKLSVSSYLPYTFGNSFIVNVKFRTFIAILKAVQFELAGPTNFDLPIDLNHHYPLSFAVNAVGKRIRHLNPQTQFVAN